MSTVLTERCLSCMSPMGDVLVCPHCGYDNATPYDKRYRKPGSLLGDRYFVGRLHRQNGEGGVYTGYDNYLQVKVWIREYFPSTLAQRDPLTGDVLPHVGMEAQFKALMSDFVDVCNDVKRMGVSEPVIPIENVLGEQGTVYAIYKDMNVVQLETWLAMRGGKLTVGDARNLLLPLLNALSNIHARGIIHRGISPYTVYVGEGGGVYLWDFCLSATRTGDSELEAELFNGYSAPEQYVSNGWQGTWTDVYGAAALFYRLVSGFVPPKSTMIGERRPLAPLIDLVMEIPPNISEAVADAMNPDSTVRTQEIGPFLSRLIQTDLSNTAVYDVNLVNEVKKTREIKQAARAEKRRHSQYTALGLLVTVVLLGGALWLVMKTYFPQMFQQEASSSEVSAGEEWEEESQEEESREEGLEAQDKTMPNLVGQKAEDVMFSSAYRDRYQFEVKYDFDSNYEEGMVFDHSPNPGATVQDGRTVILYVSKGKKMYAMPDLKGMTREEVEIALQMMVEGQFDVTYSSFDKFSSEDIEPGKAISSTPSAGEEFDPKSTRIYVFFQQEDASKPSSVKAKEPTRESQRQDDGNDITKPREIWRE